MVELTTQSLEKKHRVDFYILENQPLSERLNFLCRLLEKANHETKQVLVWSNQERELLLLNDMLWTFSDASFVPHALAGTLQANHAPILLSQEVKLSEAFDILINLTLELPSYWQNFSRIIEIIPNDENYKVAGRQRFMAYRAAGSDIKTHTMT